MELIGEAIKQLVNLQSLYLDLKSNKLGENDWDIENLVESLILLPNSLEKIVLDLGNNKLGLNMLNMEYLGQLMK